MDKVSKLADIKSEAVESKKNELQHNLNKNTAKERISTILDGGSFIEIGGMSQRNGGGVISGYGTVDGKLVFVCSHDYAVDGGTLTKANGEKICRIMDMAVEMGAPLVQIYDTIGAEVSEGLEMLEMYGRILKKNVAISGVIPHIAVVAGPTIGIDAISAGMCDFVLVVKGNGEIALKSEGDISRTEGRFIDKDELSSNTVALKSGVAQIEVDCEENLGSEIRKMISYMPSNNKGMSPYTEVHEEINYSDEELNELVNEGNVDIENVIEKLADRDSIININKEFDLNSFTGLGKINGLTAGFIGIGNKSAVGIDTCEKISRFVKVCDNFNIPMVTIVDNDGFITDLKQERAGLSTIASKLMTTIGMSDVGKVSLIVGNAIGTSFLTFASKSFGYDMVYAWPSAKISTENPVEAIKRNFRNEITGSEYPKKEEEKIINENIGEFTSPYNAAFAGIIDEVIEPAESKVRLYSILDMLQSKRVLKYPKKHGSHLI